ncbi:hypothetical protein [Woeseia oceani]|uniref:Uncharacterized protein n=1 Tax=Woeseia oceani TaxID=1548547 RepID=A0A193LJL3_9GAMM|nr:hypothetical protein [Woeseia oceani]ANO52730.1 hypothetical protein BA177_17400 [Woeseia oceani]
MKTVANAMVTIAVLAASGCASTAYEPIVDGHRNESYSTDLRACQELANEHRNVGKDAREGALLGAGLGALIGLADGSSDDVKDAIAGAVIGAAVIGGEAISEAYDKNQSIVVSCMQGRGHRVVG